MGEEKLLIKELKVTQIYVIFRNGKQLENTHISLNIDNWLMAKVNSIFLFLSVRRASLCKVFFYFTLKKTLTMYNICPMFAGHYSRQLQVIEKKFTLTLSSRSSQCGREVGGHMQV